MLRRYIVVFFLITLLFSIYVYLYLTEAPEALANNLTIYSYSSFTNAWGPGPELKRLFKEKTGKSVDFVDVGEGGVIIQRLLLEKNKPKADIVLGLDQFQLNNPDLNKLFEVLPEMELNFDESVPKEKIKQPLFIAYNWSPMTFIYRRSDSGLLPNTLEDFASANLKGKIILLDPRTSTPGYIFFHWVVQKLGEQGALNLFLKMRENIYTVAPSWSAGYGLFQKKQAEYIFSYITSPVYHWTEEESDDYQPLYLEEALPYHIEYIGILKSSPRKELAKEFLNFLFQATSQEIIMKKNYMLPVINGVKEGTEFSNLKKINLFEATTPISREAVLDIWEKIAW